MPIQSQKDHSLPGCPNLPSFGSPFVTKRHLFISGISGKCPSAPSRSPRCRNPCRRPGPARNGETHPVTADTIVLLSMTGASWKTEASGFTGVRSRGLSSPSTQNTAHVPCSACRVAQDGFSPTDLPKAICAGNDRWQALKEPLS